MGALRESAAPLSFPKLLPSRPSSPPPPGLGCRRCVFPSGPFMSFLARLALGAVLALSLFSPVVAGQPRGSAAWTDETSWVNVEASLYKGPGPQYGEIGTVGGGLRIRVARCSQ